MQVIAWILIILGAAVAFGLAAIIKKQEFENKDKQNKYFYITKIIGLWLVIIGAFLVFKQNGSFGIK